MTMTWPAPRSLATAMAYRPRPPAPWMTTLSPTPTWARSRPAVTWAMAQLTPTTSSSESSSGTLKTVWFG